MTSSEYRYLLTINGLYNGAAGIRLTAIAAAMEVTKVSVFKAVEKLEQEGLIARDAKNRVIMTQHGKDQLEKYNILIDWLSGHLEKNCRVPADTARRDAAGAVCAFSDESIAALTEFIKLEKEKRHAG
ncbi:MAG: MarR family transcriptional regulator [Ruminococcaceae bacterium]|nr:MarR family transcriptional regulator [Oscillospiraceae bacterium]